MPESTSTATPTVSATPQAGVTVTPQPQAGTTPQPEPQAGDGTNEQLSLDEARKLRKENQTLRQRQKAIDDAEEAARVAALSELDKSNKRAQDAEAKIKDMQDKLVQAQVKLAAKDKGIIDPDLAALALQSSLEFDEDGMPSNLDKALADLIKNKPYLVPASTAQAPISSAQTAHVPNAPAIPAMNPGRTNIQSPTGQPLQGRVSLSDAYRLAAQNKRT